MGQQGPGRAHVQGQRPVYGGPSRRNAKRRDVGLGRLLGAFCDAGCGAQCTGHHSNGLSLHLRIRAARCAVAVGRIRAKVLAIDDFGKDAIDSGRVDGKIYGVSLGLNSTALLYSKTAYDAAGLKPPTHETTWGQFAALSAQLSKANANKGYWGSMDGGGVEPALEVWVRQRGKALYTQDGKLGFDVKDATEWFAYWDDMRQRGACVPPDVQALDHASNETAMLSQGKAATAFEHSNLLVAYQALNKHTLSMTMYPEGEAGSKPGPYLKPSQMLSVYALTRMPEEAVQVVDFFVEDPRAARVLSTDAGFRRRRGCAH